MKQISEKRKKVFMRWLPWIALIIMINVAAHIFSRNSNSNFGLLPAILFVISLIICLVIFYFTCGEKRNFYFVLLMIILTSITTGLTAHGF